MAKGITKRSQDYSKWYLDIIAQADFSLETFAGLVSLLRRYGGIEDTRRQAAMEVSWAKEALTFFPASKIRNILTDIADYALVRRS